MSEAALVAGEIQDLARSVDNVSDAILRASERPLNVAISEQPPPVVNVTVPEQAPPVVNVTLPEQAPPSVSVAAPSVEVHPVIKAPDVVVEAQKPSAYSVRVTERDENGLIVSFIIVPM